MNKTFFGILDFVWVIWNAQFLIFNLHKGTKKTSDRGFIVLNYHRPVIKLVYFKGYSSLFKKKAVILHAF